MRQQTRVAILIAVLAAVPGFSQAENFGKANISKVIKDVKVSEKSSQARAVSEGQPFTGASTMFTGRDSRAELVFPDQTVTRVGANSVFRFRSGTRDMEIAQGSFLLNVPKNAGGAKIRTATVTAAITGTTVMMEYSPEQWLKFIVVEGVAKLILKDGTTTDVPAGRMIVMRPDARVFPRPVIVNIDKLVKTSLLADSKVFGPLNGPAVQLINGSIAEQKNKRQVGNLLPAGVLTRGPNGPIEGAGTTTQSPPPRGILPSIGGERFPGGDVGQ
jgi:hypothetical protein